MLGKKLKKFLSHKLYLSDLINLIINCKNSERFVIRMVNSCEIEFLKNPERFSEIMLDSCGMNLKNSFLKSFRANWVYR